jgi:hypothetical protein
MTSRNERFRIACRVVGDILAHARGTMGGNTA